MGGIRASAPARCAPGPHSAGRRSWSQLPYGIMGYVREAGWATDSALPPGRSPISLGGLVGGSRRLGLGEGKEVAGLVVLRVSAVAPCGRNCNVPVTTRLDSLIEMLKFFSWLCSVMGAEEKGRCVLSLLLGSPRPQSREPGCVRRDEGSPWDESDPRCRSLVGVPVSRDSE